MKKLFAVCIMGALLSTIASAEIVGTKKKGLKGRYLDLEPGVNFSDYRGAMIILEPAEITTDKDRAVDTESIRTTSDDLLKEKLLNLGLFGEVISTAPLVITEGQQILRVKTKLTIQYGSEAMRFWVGMGAGKSKSHIRLDFFDALTGKSLGYFNGYGTGAGSWSVSGGGAQWLARDDLEENYQELIELVAQKAGVALSGS